MSGAGGPDRHGPHDPYEEEPEARAGGAAPGAARIPTPRSSVEDTGQPLPRMRTPEPLVLDHRVLKSLLGAWALAACSTEETVAVEDHLGECGVCAEEALRLRDAVALLHTDEPLDLDPMLRARVLDGCLARRPARVPVPSWAHPYDAETARLDALLKDFGDGEWHAPVRLRWYDGGEQLSRKTTVAGVIAHLISVDGLVARAIGLDDPLGPAPPTGELGPEARTEALWAASHYPPTRAVRAPWRAQSHALIRTVSYAGSDTDGDGSGRLPVSYGDFALPLRDAMTDRAFECWVHAGDIAEAVDYPYEPPQPRHLHRMIDLAARLLPDAVAARRAGRDDLDAAGRLLRLEVEGDGGGEWLIPLGPGEPERCDEVAHIALDGVEFCRLAAGRVPPCDAAAGSVGDRAAIMDVLAATASLSRL